MPDVSWPVTTGMRDSKSPSAIVRSSAAAALANAATQALAELTMDVKVCPAYTTRLYCNKHINVMVDQQGKLGLLYLL